MVEVGISKNVGRDVEEPPMAPLPDTYTLLSSITVHTAKQEGQF